MSSEDKEDICEETLFVRRPIKQGGRPQRPRSSIVGSQIISNPKLVKSLQNLVIEPRQTFVRPASCSYIKVEEHEDFQKKFELQIQQHSRPWCHKYLGILLALFASFAMSLSSIIVKHISEDYHAYNLSLWTFQGILFPSLAILVFKCGVKKEPVCQKIWPLGEKDNTWNFALVLFRALCGAGGTVLKVYSLQYMTAADSTVIAFSSPVFVVIAAWIFLDEKIGFVPILTAFAVLVGVGIITRPPWITGEKEFDTELLIGCAMAFSCMLLGVFTVVILRYIRDVHYAFITFFYGLIGTLVSFCLCWWVGELKAPKTLEHWIYAFGVATLTFLGQNALTLALQYEQAGYISLVRPSEIIFIFVWQFLFLNKFPDYLSLVGAFIVLVGVFVISARKWISTLPESHHLKTHCSGLLL